MNREITKRMTYRIKRPEVRFAKRLFGFFISGKDGFDWPVRLVKDLEEHGANKVTIKRIKEVVGIDHRTDALLLNTIHQIEKIQKFISESNEIMQVVRKSTWKATGYGRADHELARDHKWVDVIVNHLSEIEGDLENTQKRLKHVLRFINSPEMVK